LPVPVSAASVDISDEYVPELDITYFFNKNIAAELILATAQHDVTATNVAAVGGADVKLGDVWVLPPTVDAAVSLYRYGPVQAVCRRRYQRHALLQ
jgi:outer membrane protein W